MSNNGYTPPVPNPMPLGHELPKGVMDRGLALAEGSTVYGVLFKDMTRDQLIAVAALGWHKYNEKLKERIFR